MGRSRSRSNGNAQNLYLDDPSLTLKNLWKTNQTEYPIEPSTTQWIILKPVDSIFRNLKKYEITIPIKQTSFIPWNNLDFNPYYSFIQMYN